MPTSGYHEISHLMETLAAEGVPPSRLGPIEAQLVTELSRAVTARQKQREASRLLATLGPDAAAIQLGCSRRAVYYRAAKKVQAA